MVTEDDAPQRIVVAGDWHGNVPWAVRVIREAPAFTGPGRTLILHLGDFGIWPGADGHDYLEAVTAALEEADAELWFIDGNHEDHPALRRHQDEWGASASLVPIRPANALRTSPSRLFWAPRGFRWTWHGRTWLALGGAVSLDRARRRAGLDWWPEEEIATAQAELALRDGPADVMVTHDCPSSVVHAFPPPPRWWAERDMARSERHRLQLQYIVDGVKPSWLMHGHLHMIYQREVAMGYGMVQVTGLGADGDHEKPGAQGNWMILDTVTMTWHHPEEILT